MIIEQESISSDKRMSLDEEWREIKLINITKFIKRGISPNYSTNGDFIVLNQRCVRGHIIDHSCARFHCSKTKKVDPEREILINDILICSTGVGTLGRVAQVKKLTSKTVVDSHVTVVRPRDGIIPEYLGYYLNFFEPILEKMGQGSTGQTELSRHSIGELIIKLPSLPKQKAIADVLSSLDNKIELNRQMNKTLESIAQVLFKSWFVDFDPVRAKIEGQKPDGLSPEIADLFPDKLVESELGLIPEEWEVSKISAIANFFNSKRIPLSSQKRALRKGTYRYFGATSVIDYIDDYLFNGSYVLAGEDGSVVAELGHPVLQYVWGKFWVNNHAHVLQGKNGWSTESLYVFLSQSDVRYLVTGAVQPKLSMSNLGSLKILNPSRNVLELFGSLIESYFSKLRILENEIKYLEALKNYLLPKLISGELCTKDVVDDAKNRGKI